MLEDNNKNITPSLTTLDTQTMEDDGIESMEYLWLQELDSMSNWEITNATTKRKLMILSNNVTKKGHNFEKNY